MQTSEHDPYKAARHLIDMLKAPSGSVNVSTYWRKDQPLSLRVFLRPEVRYLARNVPGQWEGFTVFCEIAEPAKAEASY